MHEQLHKALDRKVWLPSGGSLIIEHTEALTVIDVNTGKNVGTSSLEETVFRNNLEAADRDRPAAPPPRHRRHHRHRLHRHGDPGQPRRGRRACFRDALARDKTRTQVFDISELGLVEMTRKRIGEGLLESFADRCARLRGPRASSIDHDLLELMPSTDRRRRVERRCRPVPLAVDNAMYAVIETGGKQYRVDEGQQLEVELLGADDGAEVDAHAGAARRRRHRAGHPGPAAGRHR